MCHELVFTTKVDGVNNDEKNSWNLHNLFTLFLYITFCECYGKRLFVDDS